MVATQEQAAPAGAEAQRIVVDYPDEHARLLDEVVAKTKYSEKDRGLIRRMLTAKDMVTDDEFEIFMKYAERTGLDPFARQIYAVKRQGKLTIQIGIDGYRLIADRTRIYAGNDEPIFEGEGTFTNSRKHPAKATVTVWKQVAGERRSFSATAHWDEYFPEEPKDQWMWRKMPFGQLAKCAEALALRKAFPANLAGIYTDTEMAQVREPEAAPKKAAYEPSRTTSLEESKRLRQANQKREPNPSGLATVAQRAHMQRLGELLKLSLAEKKALISGYGATNSAGLTENKADELIVRLEQRAAIVGLASDVGLSADELTLLLRQFGASNLNDLTHDKAEELILHLNDRLLEAAEQQNGNEESAAGKEEVKEPRQPGEDG